MPQSKRFNDNTPTVVSKILELLPIIRCIELIKTSHWIPQGHSLLMFPTPCKSHIKPSSGSPKFRRGPPSCAWGLGRNFLKRERSGRSYSRCDQGKEPHTRLTGPAQQPRRHLMVDQKTLVEVQTRIVGSKAQEPFGRNMLLESYLSAI